MNQKRTIIVSLTTRMVILFGVTDCQERAFDFGWRWCRSGYMFFAQWHGQLRELMNAAKAAVEESASKV
jgi:hypothetical protein